MSPSASYAESVLSHLEKVQQLPFAVQVDIAKRIESYIEIARAAKSEAVVETLATTATEEQAKAIGQGTMDPRWAASNCRGVVLCDGKSVQGLPGPIARGSYHRSNRGVHIEPPQQVKFLDSGGSTPGQNLALLLPKARCFTFSVMTGFTQRAS
jgi:hypothetical protein